MSRAIMIASILGDFGDQPSRRIVLELRRDEPNNQHDDVEYRWFERETGNDTEVSASTINGAIVTAEQVWAGHVWDFRIRR